MGILKAVLRLITGFTLNSDLTHTVTECRELLTKAQKSIHIVAGDLESRVFEDAKILDIFREKTSGKEKNAVSIQIMYGPNPDSETHTLFELAKETPTLELIQLRSRPSGHFMIVDHKHTRIEEYHDQFTPERKAYVAYSTLFLADKLEVEFSNLKSHAVTTANAEKATA